MKAVVLFSGGLDSTTLLRIVQEKGYDISCMTFSYGQRHLAELEAARKIAKQYNITDHRIVEINLQIFGSSSLVDSSISLNTTGIISSTIPNTYVPARNTIFLSYALAFAEVIGAQKIFLGINAVDYSGYPDCRPEFLDAFNKLVNLATKTGVEKTISIEVEAPLLYLSKAEIISLGMKLGIDYSSSISCYQASNKGIACGLCDACRLRLEGFKANNLEDTAPYYYNKS
jgi:7-cyano-7-deazaguanine synthase